MNIRYNSLYKLWKVLYCYIHNSVAHAVAQFVAALCYKSEGRGFDSRWCLWHNPSGRTVALGSTQPLTEMNTRNISWGVKAADALGWQHYHLHVSIVLKSGSLKLLEPSGVVQACNGLALPYPLIYAWVLQVVFFLRGFNVKIISAYIFSSIYYSWFWFSLLSSGFMWHLLIFDFSFEVS